MIDLITPAQDAIFLALSAEFDAAEARVLQHVPQDTRPAPALVIVGEIEFADVGAKGEQAESLECDVSVIFDGADRRPLVALVNRVRGALHDLLVVQDGAQLRMRAPSGVISNAAENGRTYAAIITVIIDAEPA